MYDMLTRAIEIACKAHKGQLDKAGLPYILHPIRVMQKFSNPDYKIVAILHDVIEYSDISIFNIINEGFNLEIVSSIKALTKERKESYTEYITKRVVKNTMATAVKIEDLRDNMNLERLVYRHPKFLTNKDVERVTKYYDALQFLKENLKGKNK